MESEEVSKREWHLVFYFGGILLSIGLAFQAWIATNVAELNAAVAEVKVRIEVLQRDAGKADLAHSEKDKDLENRVRDLESHVKPQE